MTETSSAVIRAQSLRLRRMLTGLVVALGLLILLERFGAIAVHLLQRGSSPEELRRLAVAVLKALPEILYLVALWWIRQALASFAQGQLYATAVTRMLDRVGVTLALAAVFGVFILPSASAALGYSPGYIIAFDVATLVLGAIGLSLKIIAHVLRSAAEQQAELEQIF